MLILTCDTSNRTCCAGLYGDGNELAYEISMEKKTHSETFMPLLKRVVDAAGRDRHDIDAIAVTTGPGSFTGIRIGLAAVKGMCLGLDIPVIPVSSIRALAYSVENVAAAPDETILVPGFDARNNRVFASVLSGDMKELVPDGAYDASELASRIKEITDGRRYKILVTGDCAGTMAKALEGSGLDAEYSSGTVITPRGIMKASQGTAPVSAAALKATYCAVSQAERFKK